MSEVCEISPRSGTAFLLRSGEEMAVIDPLGGQVSDLIAYNLDDVHEVISNGRTFDYEETTRLTAGNRLWSNRSRPMLEIVADKVGVHDFLLTPCNEDTFRYFYPDKPLHRGCEGNLIEALEPFGIAAWMIPTAFNVFMNVPVEQSTGRLQVLPPVSEANDFVIFRAKMDLIIGLTACSAYASNGGSFKPIHYQILKA